MMAPATIVTHASVGAPQPRSLYRLVGEDVVLVSNQMIARVTDRITFSRGRIRRNERVLESARRRLDRSDEAIQTSTARLRGADTRAVPSTD